MQRQVRIVGLAGERQPEMLGERLGDLALGHQAELDQHEVQALVASLAQPQRPLQAGPLELAGRDQAVAQRLVGGPGVVDCGRPRGGGHRRST